MSTVLKGITAAIIYTPLALLILTILFIIGYGVKYYRENGDFPDAYKDIFVKYLVMTIIVFPIKLLLQLLWFIVPIMPGTREEWGYSKFGAWDGTSNNRQFSFVLLFIALFVGLTLYL